MFPEDVDKDEVSFQQDMKKLLSHVRLRLAVKEKTKTEIIRDSVTKPQLLATPKFSELLNVYDAQQEIIHAKDPRSLFAKLNKYIVTLVLASEVEGVKFEPADHDLVKESLAFMQKYMRAEKFKMTIQDINNIVSEELYRRDGKLKVTYNIKPPKMDDKVITKSASEMSSKNTIRFIHFIDAVIERNQDAAFMLTDTSQDDMNNPYLAIIQAHSDYLNCIKNLSLALDNILDFMTSVPERNAILKNILIHIHSGSDSVELLEKALNAFPELEQSKKQRLLTTLAPHIQDIIDSKLLVEEKKKSCFKMEDLPEKMQARAAILTSLGVNLLAVDDLLYDDKIQRENERTRLKSFFVPDSGSGKKDSAMESQLINLLIGGQFPPLSVDQKLTRTISTDELIASLVPNYSALANLYHSATTVAGSAFDWFKDRLDSKSQTVMKQKWEGGKYQAFLKDKKIEQRSKYDKLYPDVLGHYLELFNVIKMAEIGDSPSLKEAYLRNELKTDKKIAYYHQFASMLKQQQDQLNQFYSATLINKLKMHIIGSEVSLGNYDPKQVQMTIILDNINQLERQFLAEYQNKTIRPDKINTMTHELAEAINFFLPPLSKANVDHYQLREGFLYVTAEKMMKSYFEGTVKLILEELIDDSPANISLRSIYSKIVSGTLLDRTDIQRLQMEFDRSSQLSADKKSFLQATLSNMFKLRVSLESNPQYALSNKVELVKTPNEIDIDNIQRYIEKSNLLKITHEITTHIEAQQNEVIRLKSHITSGTVLDELCANKYAYLEEMKRAVDLIKTEMEGKDAARLIHEIMTQDSFISIDSTNPLLSLFKLIPIDLANKTTAIEKALFTRIASTISPDRLLKSKKEYERVLAQNKTLELLPFLSDPFNYDDFMQNQEVLVDQLINYLLQEESVKSALETAQKLPGLIFHKAVNEFAKHVVGAIPLGNAVIYSLGAILQHIDVQNLLRNLIDKQVSGIQQLATDQLTDQVKNVSQAILKASPLSQHSDKWLQASFDKTKGYLCKKIGVELRSVMEKNALKYIEHAVVRTDQESEAVEAAFSVFYLQYRAIKAQHKNDGSFNKIDCIKLLFKSIAPHDSIKQNEILATFEKYDKELYNEFEVANSHITTDIDTHLEFLLNHVNLADEKNHGLIKMALFNKLLLMTLEGSKHHHLAPQSIKMETLNAKIDSSLQRLESIKEESRMVNQYKKAKAMLQEIKSNSPGLQQAPAEIKEAEIKEDATKKMGTLNAKSDSSLQPLGSIEEESRMIEQCKKAKVMLQEIKNNSPDFQQAPAEIKEAEIKEDATKNQPAGPHAK